MHCNVLLFMKVGNKINIIVFVIIIYVIMLLSLYYIMFIVIVIVIMYYAYISNYILISYIIKSYFCIFLCSQENES